MNDDIKVIWHKGDEIMPEKAKKIVEAAQGELLLKVLGLPIDIVDTIRYNADKNAQTINHYISELVLERLRTAS